MKLLEKEEILNEILNHKIISINRVDRTLEFVYTKTNETKYITIEFSGITGHMGRYYFFNILDKKVDDTAKGYCLSLGKEIIYKKECIKILQDIKMIIKIEYTKNEEFEYLCETIKLTYISKNKSEHTVEFYGDDENSYIVIDGIYNTYYKVEDSKQWQ